MIWTLIVLVLLTLIVMILSIECKRDVGRAFFVTLAVMLAYVMFSIKPITR